MTITIGGLAGSGKTTVSKLIVDQMGLRYVSMGSLFRQMADRRQMSLSDFGAYAEQHPEVDKEIDRKQSEIVGNEGVVLDSRLGGWLAHRKKTRTLKVWLRAETECRVQRIAGRDGLSYEETLAGIRARELSETKRYRAFYDIDLSDLRCYDLVVDTTHLEPGAIARAISTLASAFQ